GEGGDPAEAADLAQLRLAVGPLRAVEARLDHADKPVVAQRPVDHLQIARLEDVERQASARKEQRCSQWEDRHDLGQVSRLAVSRVANLHAYLPTTGLPPSLRSQENSSDDSLRRPDSVASSVMPHASKNFSSCRRAPSSCQARSAFMIAS